MSNTKTSNKSDKYRHTQAYIKTTHTNAICENTQMQQEYDFSEIKIKKYSQYYFLTANTIANKKE